MPTQRLKTIFLLSIPFFIAHGVEEMITGFYNLNQWDEWQIAQNAFSSLNQGTFVVFQVMLWVLLAVLFVSLLGERARLYLLGLVGVMYVFELHHIFKAVLAWSYYPGLITALAFPVFALLFWKEWFRAFRNNK